MTVTVLYRALRRQAVATSGMALFANPPITKKENLLAAGNIFVSRKVIAA